MILRALLLVLALGAPAAAGEPIVIFAAASLKTALDRVAVAWEAEGGAPVVFSYAGTSILARQIEAGAPADIFFAASADWMDVLDARDLIQPGSRRDLLGNRLVLIRPGPGESLGEIGPEFDLAAALGEGQGRGRLAMALVEAVPAGIYGREALVSLGLWRAVEGRVVQTDNTRATLALVASGEVPLGVVYLSDARAEARVSIVGVFPESSHGPIVYSVGLTWEGLEEEARAFLHYLGSDTARAIFEAEGFLWLVEK